MWWSRIRVCEQKKFSAWERLINYELKVESNEYQRKIDSSLFVGKLSWCFIDDDSGVKSSLSNPSGEFPLKWGALDNFNEPFIFWVTSVQDAIYSCTGQLETCDHSTPVSLLMKNQNASRCNRPHDRTSHLPLSFCLSFNLIGEVEITFVELVNSNIAVLSSTCITLSGWVNGNGVCRLIRTTQTVEIIGETHSRDQNDPWRGRSLPRTLCDRIWLQTYLVELFWTH